MKVVFALIIAGILAGCSTLNQTQKTIAPIRVSEHELAQLQVLLRQMPVLLRNSIAHEVNSRLVADNINATDNQNAATILNSLLSDVRAPELLPDAEFNIVHSVAVGSESRFSFVAALTAYATQPDFNCRQPLLAQYFQRRYQDHKILKQCMGVIPFYIMTRLDGVRPVWLDPRRVRSIHVLFAGNGQGIASRFGHVSLRLVVCPQPDSSDVVCNVNLAEHIVLGYGAHINDIELDYFKALKGGYNAYLFASPFMEVYQNYAIGEFREMYSLPLRMTAQRREAVVQALAEIHWGFADEYHFFSRNCTTLLQQSLRTLLPEFNLIHGMSSDFMRPDYFFDALKNSHIAEGERLMSLEKAEQEGYYFSSTKPFYDQAANVIKESMDNPAFSDLETYLKIDPAIRRQAYAPCKAFMLRLHSDKHLFGAQIMLEELAIIRSEREMMVAAARYFHEHLPAKLDELIAHLDYEQSAIFNECFLSPLAMLSSPLKRTDGIPDEFSVGSPAGTSAICKDPEGHKRLDETIAIIGELDPENWQPISKITHYWKESISNVSFLKSEVQGVSWN